MRGPHFFADPVDVDLGGCRAVLRGEQAQHLTVVLRAKPGAAVSLADGTGWIHQAFVRRVDGPEVVLGLDDATFVPPAQPRLVVVHGLPRRRKLDEVVQRLSELGVDRLVPVVTRRSEVALDAEQARRAVHRWRGIALAAAKQSRRPRPLDVAEVGCWASAFPSGSRGAVLWEEATPRLRTVLEFDTCEFVLGIGPEGGLTAEVAATGLPPASLGPTILRTETAAVAAAAAILAITGRLA